MADTLDVLSVSEGRQAVSLRTNDTSLDVRLAPWITAVSRKLDKLVGPIVNRTLTDEAYDGSDEDDLESHRFGVTPREMVNGRSLVRFGATAIYLKSYPVSSVTAVKEYAGTSLATLSASTNSTKPAAGYSVNLNRGILYRRNGDRDWYFPAGRGNVLVTYVAGRAADTASVDELYKRAAAIMLRQLWTSEQSVGSDTFGAEEPGFATFAVPYAVLEMLADEVQNHPKFGRVAR